MPTAYLRQILLAISVKYKSTHTHTHTPPPTLTLPPHTPTPHTQRKGGITEIYSNTQDYKQTTEN